MSVLHLQETIHRIQHTKGRSSKRRKEVNMAYFQVTSSELKSKAGRLSDLNSQFKARASQLGEQETSLCSMWEGQAKDTFHQAFLRDRQQMDVFIQLIDRYIQALLEIANRYEQAENRNREIAAARKY